MQFIRNLLFALVCVPALFAVRPAMAEPVNINTADAAALARELVGIGDTRAKAIVDYRTQNGPFRSVEELALVKGIGPRVIEQNRANLRVEPARAADRRVPVPAARGKAAPPAGSRAATGGAGSRPVAPAGR
jgi:competence protein ComEA